MYYLSKKAAQKTAKNESKFSNLLKTVNPNTLQAYKHSQKRASIFVHPLKNQD